MKRINLLIFGGGIGLGALAAIGNLGSDNLRNDFAEVLSLKHEIIRTRVQCWLSLMRFIFVLFINCSILLYCFNR